MDALINKDVAYGRSTKSFQEGWLHFYLLGVAIFSVKPSVRNVRAISYICVQCKKIKHTL